MLHPALDCKNGAKVGVAAAPEADDLVFDTVFLGGEGEGGLATLRQFFWGGESEVESAKTNGELDVGQGEWHGIGRRIRVFPRAKEVEEGDDDHIRFRPKEVGISGEMLCDEGNASDDSDGDWFYT